MTIELFARDNRDSPLGSFPLPIVFGRSETADLTIDDRWVSREHCVIDLADGNVILRDLDSTHGTLVNRELVSEAILSPGDEIGIGLNRFIVRWDGKFDDASSSREDPAEVA